MNASLEMEDVLGCGVEECVGEWRDIDSFWNYGKDLIYDEKM